MSTVTNPAPLTPPELEVIKLHRKIKRAKVSDRDLSQEDVIQDALIATLEAAWAENERLRGILKEIGRATHIDWPDDVVTDPAGWIEGILREKP